MPENCRIVRALAVCVVFVFLRSGPNPGLLVLGQALDASGTEVAAVLFKNGVTKK